MICPYCKEDNNKVTGRGKQGLYAYRRNRKCLNCGKNFKTIEYYVPEMPTDSTGRIKGWRKKKK